MKNKHIYSIYFINDNHLKRLYNSYIHQTKIEKIFDYLIFIAIIFTIMELILEFIIKINENTNHIIHNISGIIFIIFILELIIEYSKSKNFKEFINKNLIDFLLIIILSFFFLFTTYFGISKLTKLTKINEIISKIKHIKISLKIFKK